MNNSKSIEEFIHAREFLLKNRDDYQTAYKHFKWPQLTEFNWALDWFDNYARNNNQTALHLINDQGENKLSFNELSSRSSRVAEYLTKNGLRRGDRLLVMLPNVLAQWEVMLACQKLGAVIVPTATQATVNDLKDRIERGNIKMVLTDKNNAMKFEELKNQNIFYMLDGDQQKGWHNFNDARAEILWTPKGVTYATDPLLLYFTSGTTAKPKLVLHTHQSYPVGHLSTMYWIGIKEKSTHQNISSPGWAKHAWSSFYAPWNAGATILVHDFGRFEPKKTLSILRENSVNSLCAPPTVWRMLILEALGEKPKALSELVSAGEPLNPEIIEEVKSAWGITIRDGYGQTETSAQIGNSPNNKIKLGSMGRPLPGYKVTLLDQDSKEVNEGEVALKLNADRPLGLMERYLDDQSKTDSVMAHGFYRTGDEALIDDDGYFHFVGRGDDVFKSSDYRISPFELESVLLEHEHIAESAVIPSPDPVRLSVPKAIIVLKPGIIPSAELAKDIFVFAKDRLANYKLIRRIEFSELPKTISGKIRRVQLRQIENERRANGERSSNEYWLEDFKH